MACVVGEPGGVPVPPAVAISWDGGDHGHDMVGEGKKNLTMGAVGWWAWRRVMKRKKLENKSSIERRAQIVRVLYRQFLYIVSLGYLQQETHFEFEFPNGSPTQYL